MKKAGNVLIIVGTVFTIFTIVGLLITGIIFLISSNPDNKQVIMDKIADGTITTSFTGSVSEQADKIQQLLKVLGVVFMILTGGYLLIAIVSFLAIAKKTKGFYITTIVLNVIFFNLLTLLGGIFALVGEESN